MGRANGAVAGVIDGPQPGHAAMVAQATAIQQEHAPAIAEQDARFEVRIEALGPVEAVKFTLLNKHVTDLNPPAIYVPLSAILRIAGQYLLAMTPGGGQVG